MKVSGGLYNNTCGLTTNKASTIYITTSTSVQWVCPLVKYIVGTYAIADNLGMAHLMCKYYSQSQ